MRLETKIEMLGNPAMEFSLSKYDLHDLLADTANAHDEYWTFAGKGIQRVADNLTQLFAVSNGCFSFQATWGGSEAVSVEYLTIGEFIDIVRRNRIGTRTKYIVTGQ